MISDATPSACCWFYLAVAIEPYLAPVPPIVQEAVGGDSAAAERFFGYDTWAKNWSPPLWLAFARADGWQTAAGWWRAARERREGRFLSLDEINSAWESDDGIL